MVLVTLDVVLGGPLRQLDHAVHEVCDARVRGAWLEAVHAATKLGQRGGLATVIVGLSVLAAVRQRSPRYPVAGLGIVVGLSLVQSGLKSLVPRTYPFTDTDVLFAGGNAYPSGHTLNGFVLVWVVLELAVGAWPALERVLTARRRRDLALAAGAVTAAALTAADEHWLTDVLFSLALGPVLLSGLIAAAPFRPWAPLLPAERGLGARATRTGDPRPGPEQGR